MSSPLPVLFYYPYNQSMTGGPRVVLNLTDRLEARRFFPIVATQRESPLTDELRRRGVKTVVIPFPEILDVYEGKALSYSLLQKLRSAAALVNYNRRIEAVCREYGVRAMWGRNIKSVLLTGLAARRLRLPLVWDIGLERSSQGFVRLLHWAGLAAATVVVTEGASQPADIFDPLAVKVFRSKFKAINPGIGCERVAALREATAPTEAEVRFDVLTVGTISSRKNPLMLLQAVAPLVQRHPQLRVRLVGGTDDEEYLAVLQEFIEANNLEEHVELLGWRDDVPSLMSQADVYVMCSRNEGIPYVLHEAMHAELPIVATRAGGMPDAVAHEETGFLVDKENEEQLRRRIEHLIDHEDERGRMGEAGRRRAEQTFSGEAWAANYQILFEQLVGEAPAVGAHE